MAKPFDFTRAASDTKEDLIGKNPDEEANYIPWLANRHFSYFLDTLIDANYMNQFHVLDKKLQFDYYLHSLTKKKRFTKWAKPNIVPEYQLIIDEICSELNIRKGLAEKYFDLISEEEKTRLLNNVNERQ